MRNIWQIVVGVVVAIGAGVALYNSLSDGEPAAEMRPPPTPPAAHAHADAAEAGAPQPEAVFGAVEVGADDYVLGKPDAPVTVIEYASLTCSHCASFHNDVLPELKKRFIDVGKVRLVYRDFPLDRWALAASMIARCAGRDRYFGFIDAMYRDQQRWTQSPDPMDSLSRIARLGGMSADDVEACLADEALRDEILQARLDAQSAFQVSATPTLIVNGRKFGGGLSFAQLGAVLESILARP